MTKSTYMYVTYIRTTREKLWTALTDKDFIRQYWFGMRVDCDFRPGSPWALISQEGVTFDSGAIVEAEPPQRLVIRWTHQNRPELKADGESICSMDLEESGTAVKLTIIHSVERSPSKFIEAVSGGWPKILSNLKSLLETGRIALEDAYPAKAAAD